MKNKTKKQNKKQLVSHRSAGSSLCANDLSFLQHCFQLRHASPVTHPGCKNTGLVLVDGLSGHNFVFDS